MASEKRTFQGVKMVRLCKGLIFSNTTDPFEITTTTKATALNLTRNKMHAGK